MGVSDYEREQIAHMIEVMQAYTAGKSIQWREKTDHAPAKWSDCEPCWDWSNCEYRVKPEPRRAYVVQLDKGGCLFAYESPERAKEALFTHPKDWAWSGWMAQEDAS